MTYKEVYLIKTAGEQPGVHVIKKKDNFWNLDKQYGLPSGSFQKANPNIDPKELQVGQRLVIPAIKSQASVRPNVKPSVRISSKNSSFKLPGHDYRFNRAIIRAQTGGQPDPWIRTKHRPKGGSTAYGPSQVTWTKIADYYDRYPEAMAAHKDFIQNTLKPMYSNFIKYGNQPHKKGYDKRWQYGGSGDLVTPQQRKSYQNMILTMQAIDNHRARQLLPKGTQDQINLLRLKLWRGKPMSEDPRYYKAWKQQYNR